MQGRNLRAVQKSGAKILHRLEKERQRRHPHPGSYSSPMETLCHLLVQVTKAKAAIRSDCLIIYIFKVYKHLSRRKVTYFGLVKDTANLRVSSSFGVGREQRLLSAQLLARDLYSTQQSHMSPIPLCED